MTTSPANQPQGVQQASQAAFAGRTSSADKRTARRAAGVDPADVLRAESMRRPHIPEARRDRGDRPFDAALQLACTADLGEEDPSDLPPVTVELAVLPERLYVDRKLARAKVTALNLTAD